MKEAEERLWVVSMSSRRIQTVAYAEAVKEGFKVQGRN